MGYNYYNIYRKVDMELYMPFYLCNQGNVQSSLTEGILYMKVYNMLFVKPNLSLLIISSALFILTG